MVSPAAQSKEERLLPSHQRNRTNPLVAALLPKSDLAVPVGGEMTFEDASKSPKKESSAGGSGGSMISYNNPALPSGASPARKDPNVEFFMMTILSYKLTHKEYDKVLAVSIH